MGSSWLHVSLVTPRLMLLTRFENPTVGPAGEGLAVGRAYCVEASFEADARPTKSAGAPPNGPEPPLLLSPVSSTRAPASTRYGRAIAAGASGKATGLLPCQTSTAGTQPSAQGAAACLPTFSYAWVFPKSRPQSRPPNTQAHHPSRRASSRLAISIIGP